MERAGGISFPCFINGHISEVWVRPLGNLDVKRGLKHPSLIKPRLSSTWILHIVLPQVINSHSTVNTVTVRKAHNL
jgi:hypothetical protein